jgi:hypothetical protein
MRIRAGGGSSRYQLQITRSEISSRHAPGIAGRGGGGTLNKSYGVHVNPGVLYTLGAVATVLLAFAGIVIGPGVVAVALGLIAMMFFANRPRPGFILWLVGTATIPIWAGVDVVAFISPSTAIVIVLIPLLLKHGVWKIGAADAIVGLFLIFCLFGAAISDVPPSAIATVMVQWIPAYIVGRALAPTVGRSFVYGAIASVFAGVGAWAIIEFVLDAHVFETFYGFSDQSFWRTIQSRGGVDRSEAAFGHAIALGGALAVGIPFVLVAPFRKRTRVILLLLVGVGIICTFSRGPMLAGAATALLAVIFLRNELGKSFGWGFVLLAGVAGFALVPRLLEFFNSAGNELADGTNYRERLFASFFNDLQLIGTADGVFTDSAGTHYRQYTSIDSAFIDIGLTYGLLPLGLIIVGIVAIVLGALRGNATPARVAILGQLPTLFTVALITQYGAVVWFVAGIASATAFTNFRQPAPVLTKPNARLAEKHLRRHRQLR